MVKEPKIVIPINAQKKRTILPAMVLGARSPKPEGRNKVTGPSLGQIVPEYIGMPFCLSNYEILPIVVKVTTAK